MKKLWLIIIITAMLGIVLMGTGYALGGGSSNMPQILKETNMTKFINDADLSRRNTEAISEIQIDVLSAAIEIVPAESYGYELLFGKNSGVEYRFENGVLSVEQEHRWLSFPRLMFWGPHTGTIRVYVPRNAELLSVKIETASGNITASDITAGELEASAKSGHINFRRVKTSHMDIDVTSGNSTLEDCSIESLEVSAASGRFTAENISVSKDFDADIISGNLSISGDLRGNAAIKIVSGSVKLDLAGNAAAYNKNLSSVSGSIRVNGNKIGAYSENFGAANALKIHTTSGSISVDFKN